MRALLPAVLALCSLLGAAPTIVVRDSLGTNVSAGVSLSQRVNGPVAYRGFYITNGGDGTLSWTLAATGTGGTQTTDARLIAISGATCATDQQCSGTNTGSVRADTYATAAGTYTWNVTITAAGATNSPLTIPLQITKTAETSLISQWGYLVDPASCSSTGTTGWMASDKDTCTMSNFRPPSTAFTVPARGSTYTSEFGATVRVISAPNSYHSYSAMSALNSDGTLALVSDDGGVAGAYILNTSTGAVVRTNPPYTDLGTWWSATDPDVYYYRSAGTVRKYVVSTQADSLWIDLSSHGTNFHSGGTGDINKLGWIPLVDTTAQKVCVAGVVSQNYACASYAAVSPAVTLVDFPLVTKGRDATTGKAYLILQSRPTLHVWEINETGGNPSSLTYSFAGPRAYEYSIDYYGANRNATASDGTFMTHSDTYEDPGGNQYLIALRNVDSASPGYSSWAYAFLIRKGLDLQIPSELGGGAYVIAKIATTGDVIAEDHEGCAKNAPYCLISLTAFASALTSFNVTGATNASPIEVTTGSAHGYTTGDQVNIGRETSLTNMNGVHTITVTGTNRFTLNGTTGNGMFSGGAVDVGKVTTISQTSHRGFMLLFRMGAGAFVRPLSVQRGVPYSSELSEYYYNTARGSISADAKTILYDTNFGEPNGTRVVVSNTGVGSGAPTSRVSGRAAFLGTASLR